MEEKKITAYIGFNKDMTPRLLPIPANTVVHTPTEAEAKELLAILHENGYKLWNGHNLLVLSDGFARRMNAIIIRPAQGVVDWYDSIDNAPESITLAEFKRLYCEEEKPRPKFNKGDKGLYNSKDPYRISEIITEPVYCLIGTVGPHRGQYTGMVTEKYLKPYTEPETKPTEDMKAKELNLCELLKGHENEEFFSLIAGKCRLKEINEGAGFPICIILDACTTWEYLTKDGKRFNVSDARCMLFPSRALYEQYPLDPYTAWMKWQEEQKKHWVSVGVWVDDSDVESDMVIDTPKIYFRTLSDRDKCIEEINAIIEKYSKK